MNLHRLDLVSLWLFTCIARTGSISGGAELAHMAVASASKRMADLETAVGPSLLQRHSRGVTLTLAGESMYQHALRVLADIDRMAVDLSDHVRGVCGAACLWANTSAVTQFLPQDLAVFGAQFPGIRVKLHEQDSQAVAMAVLDGRADAGILAEHTPTLGLHTLPYREDRLVVVAPRSHALAVKRQVAFSEVVEHDFVSLTPGTSLAHQLARESSTLGKSMRIRIHVRSFDAMCQMVAAGLGIAVLPEAAVRPHLRSMGLKRIDLTDAWRRRQLLLCAKDFSTLTRPARTLIEHLVDSAIRV